MSVELGTQPWLDALRQQLNSSEDFQSAAGGWELALGLAFLSDSASAPTRRAWLEFEDGLCTSALVVSRERFEEAPFALSGTYDVWWQVAGGWIEPMKAIILKRLEFHGATLKAMKLVPAAKRLLDCACQVTTAIPARRDPS